MGALEILFIIIILTLSHFAHIEPSFLPPPDWISVARAVANNIPSSYSQCSSPSRFFLSLNWLPNNISQSVHPTLLQRWALYGKLHCRENTPLLSTPLPLPSPWPGVVCSSVATVCWNWSLPSSELPDGGRLSRPPSPPPSHAPFPLSLPPPFLSLSSALRAGSSSQLSLPLCSGRDVMDCGFL